MIASRGIASASRHASRGMASISFAQFGAPKDVLKVGPTVTAPAPTGSQVMVAVKLARVSTKDIASINGLNMNRRIPGVGGSIAVGTSRASGGTVLVSGEGVWNDEVTVPTTQAFPVPSALTDDQLAVLDVVASAWGVLSGAGLSAGDVVLSDKSNALFDAAVTAVGKHMGFKVVDKVDESTKVKLAVTFATGSNFHNLASHIAFGGSVVSMAGLPAPASSAEGVAASVRSLVFQDLRIRGFDFNAWAASRPEEVARAVSEASKLIAAGKVSIPVEKVTPEKFASALTAAADNKAAAIVFGK